MKMHTGTSTTERYITGAASSRITCEHGWDVPRGGGCPTGGGCNESVDRPTYDEVTAWVREHHKAQVSVAYPDSSAWFCSCGAGDSLRTMPHRIAHSARARHLRAQRKRHEDALYAESLRLAGEVEDANRTML